MDLWPYKDIKFFMKYANFILGILYCIIMSGFHKLGHICCEISFIKLDMTLTAQKV